MTEQSEPPVPVGAAEIDRVVQILVGAFYQDPTWGWAFPDPRRRRQQHDRLWRAMVEGAVRYPNTWLNAEGTATAVWIPPGGEEMSAAQQAALPALVGELVGDDAGRILDTFDAFEAARPQQPAHFYLTLLGTDPDHRGKGSGLRLLADTLRFVDDAAAPAYLEASNPVNVALYARYGFRTHGTLRLPHGAPEVTTMWRDPVR